ncbi:MAG: hypothetical protein A2V98_04800 [Planctomycetes bacterium RBG_16_64_12]|nr:MAG: hypothetical protein A2V98_04800 [Planctomycetes bacterium RBG_16_64_12]
MAKQLRYRLCRKSGRYPAWLDQVRRKSGAYVIRDRATHATLYVGESHTGRLGKTITRHFQAWTGKTAGDTFRRGRVEVAVIPCPPASAVACQERLIRRLRPPGNQYGTGEEAPF